MDNFEVLEDPIYEYIDDGVEVIAHPAYIDENKSWYYEIPTLVLQVLEIQYGVPDSFVTRSWEQVRESKDGVLAVIESVGLLDPMVITYPPLTAKQARTLLLSPKYHTEELV